MACVGWTRFDVWKLTGWLRLSRFASGNSNVKRQTLRYPKAPPVELANRFISRTPNPEPLPMPDLTSKQRADLRGRAHALKPIVHVGKEGVTPAGLRALQQAFDTRDLLKVRVLDNAPADVREIAHELAAGVQDAAVVQTMGRNATLYRPLPEPPAAEPSAGQDAKRKSGPKTTSTAKSGRGRRAKRA